MAQTSKRRPTAMTVYICHGGWTNTICVNNALRLQTFKVPNPLQQV